MPCRPTTIVFGLNPIEYNVAFTSANRKRPTMNSNEIRERFLSYFESQGHSRVASSSLIPVGDPTLLLTNAGMVQFKPYFSGEATPPNRRLTSSQKSFRTVDIDEVGDATHLTMFEMLGNFSFGDYFKDGAMEFAVDCLESAMGLPRENFAATVHEGDDEAYDLWQKHGIPTERIYRFGDADNWWGPPIHGDEGPCGPCAELHYDFGDARPGCGLDDCGPNCENVNPDTGSGLSTLRGAVEPRVHAVLPITWTAAARLCHKPASTRGWALNDLSSSFRTPKTSTGQNCSCPSSARSNRSPVTTLRRATK